MVIFYISYINMLIIGCCWSFCEREKETERERQKKRQRDRQKAGERDGKTDGDMI